MGTAIQHPVPDRVVAICNFWHPGTLTLRTERQSARMSKITNGNNPVWHRMLYSCTHMAAVGVKGLIAKLSLSESTSVDSRNMLIAEKSKRSYTLLMYAHFENRIRTKRRWEILFLIKFDLKRERQIIRRILIEINVIAYIIKYKTIYTENRVISTYGKNIQYKRVQFLLNERHNRLVVVAARFSVKKNFKTEFAGNKFWYNIILRTSTTKALFAESDE